jgi:hypothetical protein
VPRSARKLCSPDRRKSMVLTPVKRPSLRIGTVQVTIGSPVYGSW